MLIAAFLSLLVVKPQTGQRWRVRVYPGHITVLRSADGTALGEWFAPEGPHGWVDPRGRPVVQRLRRRIFRAVLAALALAASPGTAGAP